MRPRLLLLRGAFGLAERVAPGSAARRAASLWFTVPAPRTAPTPAAPGDATEFAIDLPTGMVRGRTWGRGPAVYFMHGWGGRSEQINAYVAPLVAQGLRVVTFDAPGHGTSDRRRRTHAVEFARALEAVQSAHGPVHAVIAHSLGAVALMVALRSGGTAPHRVVLLAPLARVDGQLDRLGRLLGLGKRTRAGLDHEVVATTGLTVEQLALAGLTSSVPGRDTLVVHDRDDTFAPYTETAALVSHWPGATLVTTRGLGHTRLLADADVVATVVARLTQEAASADAPDDAAAAASAHPQGGRPVGDRAPCLSGSRSTRATWPETLGF